jgi:hypothetical protein
VYVLGGWWDAGEGWEECGVGVGVVLQNLAIALLLGTRTLFKVGKVLTDKVKAEESFE